MLLHMSSSPGQGQINQDDKISKLIRALIASIISVEFDYDIPNTKETRGKKTF